MSNKNVSVKVRIQGIATEIRDRDNANSRPGKNGTQKHITVTIPVFETSREEFDQRLADAEAVLKYGREVDNDSPPIPITDGAVVTGSTTATVYGTAVLVQGIETTAFFERGAANFLDSNESHLAADESPLSDVGTHSVHATLIGLTPGTRYAYRLRLANSTGTKYGITKFFTTDDV